MKRDRLRILAVCMVPIVSACATFGQTGYGQTEPVVFCCSGYDKPQHESLASLGIVSDRGTSQRAGRSHQPGADAAALTPVVDRDLDVKVATQQPIIDHESAVLVATQPSLADQGLESDSTYDVDLSECSREGTPKASGWARVGRIVTGAGAGALGGVWIGGHAGLPGMALGSMAGLVAGGVAGYALSVNDVSVADQYAVTKCMALRGHRSTGVIGQ